MLERVIRVVITILALLLFLIYSTTQGPPINPMILGHAPPNDPRAEVQRCERRGRGGKAPNKPRTQGSIAGPLHAQGIYIYLYIHIYV